MPVSASEPVIATLDEAFTDYGADDTHNANTFFLGPANKMSSEDESVAPVVAAAAAAPPVVLYPDLHAVLTVCGIPAAATRTRIIDNEGFTSVEDLAVLETDTDVSEMAKRMASRTAVDGRVNLGTVQIKRIQALAWWVRDRVKHGQPIVAADFNAAAMHTSMERKHIEKERGTTDASVKDLNKFNPDDFDVHEDAFLNLLAQTYGAHNEPIRYIVRPMDAPTEFIDTMEERMFQLPLVGPRFEEDNRVVYRKLKAFLIDTAGWAWIEPFNASEDGRSAFWAWSDHYNGRGEMSKRTALAKARIDSLHYKNERSMSFEKYTEFLTKAFTTLEKDEDERLSNRQKVERLIKGINTGDAELQASKAVIMQNYPRDFVGACAYFSQQVSRLHGGAQLEDRKYRKRRISEVNTSGGRGRGRGRGRGHGQGHGGGRGGQGGHHEKSGGKTVINGIDVSDLTRSFTAQEWEALRQNGGRAYVMQARERMNSQGGRGHGTGGHNQRNVSATNTERKGNAEDGSAPDTTSSSNSKSQGDKGGQHGRGFGRSAYKS